MKTSFLGLCVGVAILLGPAAQGMPAAVLLLRHAEKPDDGNELSERGWQRAHALPEFFSGRSEIQKYGAPAALYAMSPKHDGSVRAGQTLKFVAEDFHLKILTPFSRADVDELFSQISHDPALNGKFVVICWEHKRLKDIAKAFGIHPAPKYPGDHFDRAWLISPVGGTSARLADLAERLLPGDDAN